jgi:DNA-binding NarL/FixJ family response regulator
MTGGSGLSSAPVRVVLAGMSRMTRELIRRILEEEQGIEVIGEVPDATLAIRDLAPDAEADVIIVGTSDPDLLTRCRALLDGHVPRRVIAVSPDGRDAHLYGIRPYEAAIDEFSPELVIEVVLDASSPLEQVAT